MALEILRETDIESIVKRRQHRTSDGTYSFTRRTKNEHLCHSETVACVLRTPLQGTANGEGHAAQQPERSSPSAAPSHYLGIPAQEFTKSCVASLLTLLSFAAIMTTLRRRCAAATRAQCRRLTRLRQKKTDFVDFVTANAMNG